MKPTVPASHQPPQCLHCGVALDGLAQRRGATTCGAARCRHLADAAQTARLRAGYASGARLSADRWQTQQTQQTQQSEQSQREGKTQAAQGPHASTPVLWLQPVQQALVPVTVTERNALRAHLQAAAADALRIDHTQLGGWQPQPSQSPQGLQLCRQCGGHCCMHGLGGHAFVDLPLLERWVDAHAGSTAVDAIESYLAQVPALHVKHSCLYQGDTGCALPREQRSEICNTFACDALLQMQKLAAADPAATALAITVQRDAVVAVALIDSDNVHPLPLPG